MKQRSCSGNRSTAPIGEEEPGGGDGGANSRAASAREAEGENHECRHHDDRFRRGELEEFEVVHRMLQGKAFIACDRRHDAIEEQNFGYNSERRSARRGRIDRAGWRSSSPASVMRT